MSGCLRFEKEALPSLEAGLALDDHFSTCSDCLAARRKYERIQAEIHSLGSDQAPAEGWEAQVWQRIRSQGARRRPLLGWWLTVPAAASLVAAVFIGSFVVLQRRPGIGETPKAQASERAGATAPILAPDASPMLDAVLRLAVLIEHDKREARRGNDARPGDRLTVSATVAPTLFAQVRVYQNERRLLCETVVQSDASRPVELRASCLLESAGRYQILVLTGDQPLPATLGTPDDDAGAAFAVGARVKLGPDIYVQ